MPTRRHIVVLLVLLLPAIGAHRSPAAQAINPALLSERWQAQWIAYGDERGAGVFLFRRVFELDRQPVRFVVHASADQRYELFVNGRRMATGPARGDLDHWRFETVDLARALRAGRNVIAAVVWNFGEHAPMAQVSHRTGFVLQGDGEAEAVVNSGPGWKSRENGAWTLLPVDRASIFHQYFVSGPGEQIDGAGHPWGWEQPGYDDSGWPAATVIGVAAPRAIRDSPSRWFLVPRGIPPMEERLDRLVRVARTDGPAVPGGVLQGSEPWVVPARTRVTVLLDRGELTTAYPEVVISGGRGASIDVTYGEALLTPRPDGRRGEKGNRDEIEGKVLTGLRDRFLPDGGDDRLFRPLWWRTYRYVEVAVETADTPLTIRDIRGRFTAYPMTLEAAFDSSDPALKRIFEVGWRTARLCAHETYMDTPYWEQLQYVGDTRIQALVSLYLSGDDRLVKHAIELFDESRVPEGLTQSRYPTDLPQMIPPFSLFWVGMLHDFWWHSGDIEFVRRYRQGVDGVLAWFEARLLPNSLLGPLEWWNYADWVDSFPHGEPPATEQGESAIISLQFVLALREAADLAAAWGDDAQAAAYRTQADRVAGAVRQACWDGARGLIADTPAKDSFSQHANLLAVLADVVPASGQRALMQKVLDDASLTQTTYYFKFYLFRALRKAGLADRYLDLLDPWKTMLDLGLTAWAEKPEPTRSDSHAWSAHPSVDLLTTVAGIRPSAPGFTSVLIEPHLGDLTTLHAAVPTPSGRINVEYRRDAGRLHATVTLPAGISGTLVWKERSAAIHSGTQQVTLGIDDRRLTIDD